MILDFFMYFLAFSPLWISVVFIDIISIARHETQLWTEKISILVIIFLMLVSAVVVNKWIKKKCVLNVERYELKAAREERFLTAEFVMSYVFPLFVFDFTRWDGVVQFLVFFCLLGFLVYRHSYFCTNLFLEIMGYKVYECQLERGECSINKRVVSKKDLSGLCGKNIRTKKFNNDYHFEVNVF